MSEALEHLWEKYQITQDPEDLRNYNILRRESGLGLYREDNFLDEWAERLFEYLKKKEPCTKFYPDREVSRIPGTRVIFAISDEEIREESRVAIKHNAIAFCFTTTYRNVDESKKLFIKLALPGNKNSVPQILYIDLIISENQIIIKDSETPWSIEKDNFFLNEREILEFLLTNGEKLLEEKIQDNANKVKIEPSKNNFLTYLAYARHRRIKHLRQNPELFNLVFLQDWFRELLYKYAQKIEKFCQKRDLTFDLEQIWPMKAVAKPSGAILKIETGYNDTLSESTDETDYGENRGYAGEEADKLADFLNIFDQEHGMASQHSWMGDYDIEELDKENGEVSFEISAEKTLTTNYIFKFITEVSKF